MIRGRGWGVVGTVIVVAASIGYVAFVATRDNNGTDVPPGCQVALDDFGAGYTSFRNLRKLGVDLVKIDGAFVQNITRSDDDRAFVHTLIDLARRLGVKTVAEWVQDEAAAAMLADWGCDYLQGALVGLASPERPWLGAQAAAASA